MDEQHDAAATGERPLESWKEIADYLQRTVRTAKRWEQFEGLPVRRHLHLSRASVYAYRSELDAWVATRQPRAQPPDEPRGWSWRPAFALAVALLFPLISPSSSPLRTASAGQAGAMAERRVWAGPDVAEGGISPDGRFATAVQWSTGNLVIRELDTGEVRSLTDKGTWADSGEFAEQSIFSPDGAQVAYAWCCEGRDGDDGYGLRVIDLNGGNVRTLLSADYLQPMDWSPDGRWIATLLSREDGEVLALVEAATGETRVLATLPGGVWPRGAAFSPDGRFVAYERPPVSDPQGADDIYVAATADGSGVRLIDHPATDRMMDWSPDGRFVVFLSDRSGRQEAWAVGVDGNRPTGVPFRLNASLASGGIQPHGFTADGRLFYRAFSGERETWVVDFDPDTGRLETPSLPVSTAVAGANHGPAWSPDGSVLAFLRRWDADMKLVLRNLATGGERELEINPDGVGVRVSRGTLRWAPDGSRIVFVGNDPQGRRGLHFLNVATGRTETALLAGEDGAGGLRWPMFSPDGRSIYYLREEPGFHIVRWDLASGERSVLYSAPSDDARDFIAMLEVSPDGRRLAFVLSASTHRLGQELYVMSSDGGEPVRLFAVESPAEVGLQAFTADSAYVLFTRETIGRVTELWRVPVAGGAAERIETGLSPFLARVHPDGRQLAVDTQTTYAELWAVENLLGTIGVPAP